MLTKVVSDLEAQWSRHSIIAAQIRTALDAINGYRVVGASEPCGGPTLGKTAGAVTLITTDHMPFDVAFRGGKSVVEVAAGAGAESVEAVGAPPLETGAITTAAWLSDAGLKPDISCEYPLAGTYVPLLKRKTARTCQWGLNFQFSSNCLFTFVVFQHRWQPNCRAFQRPRSASVKKTTQTFTVTTMANRDALKHTACGTGVFLWGP